MRKNAYNENFAYYATRHLVGERMIECPRGRVEYVSSRVLKDVCKTLPATAKHIGPENLILRLNGYSLTMVNDGFGFEQFKNCRMLGVYMPDPVLAGVAKRLVKLHTMLIEGKKKGFPVILPPEEMAKTNRYDCEYDKIAIIDDVRKLLKQYEEMLGVSLC